MLIDDIPLTDISVRSLRSLIGVVSQEPRLFALSVRECIAMGTNGTPRRHRNIKHSCSKPSRSRSRYP